MRVTYRHEKRGDHWRLTVWVVSVVRTLRSTGATVVAA